MIDVLFFVAFIFIAPLYIYISCSLFVDTINRSIFYHNKDELIIKAGPLPYWRSHIYNIDSILKLQAIKIKGNFRIPTEYSLEIITRDGNNHIILDSLDSREDVLITKHQLSLLKDGLVRKEGIDLDLTQSEYLARSDKECPIKANTG